MLNFFIGITFIIIGISLFVIGIHGIKFLWYRSTKPYYVQPGMAINKKTGLVRGVGGYWKNL